MSDAVGRVSDIVRRGAKSSKDGRQDQGCGDEGDVHCEEGDAVWKVAGIEEACVGALHEGNAGVVAEGLGDLAIAGVNGENPGGTVLEHAVGETAGGGADVEAEAAGKVDVPVVQSAFELEPAAADVAEVGAEDADGGVVGHGMTGFVGLLFADEDAAGKDEGLGAFAGGDEAALHQQFVETDFHGLIFHGRICAGKFREVITPHSRVCCKPCAFPKIMLPTPALPIVMQGP